MKWWPLYFAQISMGLVDRWVIDHDFVLNQHQPRELRRPVEWALMEDWPLHFVQVVTVSGGEKNLGQDFVLIPCFPPTPCFQDHQVRLRCSGP